MTSMYNINKAKNSNAMKKQIMDKLNEIIYMESFSFGGILHEIKKAESYSDTYSVMFREKKSDKDKHTTLNLYYKVTDKMIDIDENIADLIQEIWKADIKTENSCESNVPADYIWIQFSDNDSLIKFIDIVSTNIEKGDLFYRMLCSIGIDAWDIKRNFYRSNNVLEENYSIRFPKKDYDYVLGKMKEYNQKQ